MSVAVEADSINMARHLARLGRIFRLVIPTRQLLV